MISCFGFGFSDSRRVLMPTLVSHLHYHLFQKQEMRKCGEVLGELLTALQTKAKVRFRMTSFWSIPALGST